jgi:hypothetical protein
VNKQSHFPYTTATSTLSWRRAILESDQEAQDGGEGTPGTNEQIKEADTERGDAIEESRSTVDRISIDWLERLRSDAPSLVTAYDDFIGASRRHEVALSLEVFTERLQECFARLGMYTPVPEGVLKMLFDQAVRDLQSRAAYKAFTTALQTDLFDERLRFLQGELKRLDEVSKLLSKPREFAVPRRLSEWESVWIGSLRELTDSIKAQLHSAEETSAFMRDFLSMGRTKVESRLLCSAHGAIAEAIDGTKPRLSVHQLLVAYAHASELVPYEDLEADGDPVEAMKNRISRASRSPTRTSMVSLLLLQDIF